MPIDERMVTALHLEVLRREDVHPETDPDVLFQTSTIGALLDGAYDGDVTFGELGRHGDLGLGTFDACDGEMIAVDGSFYRASIDGRVHPVPDDERTPFAVVTFFEPTAEVAVDRPIGHDELLRLLERSGEVEAASAAVRVDGRFERVEARSVARQSKPYRPLVEVVGDQRVFEFDDIEGTLVGFRFPDYAQGVEVPGYHLHFISADRSRGGHVLDCRIASGTAFIASSSEMHLELPSGVDLTSAASSDDVDRVERSDESGGAPQS